MYYAHFGLKEPPFKITPNTEFFFSGANRGAVLDALIYAISSGEGIVKVVGEVGSGKTMLCRMLQSLLPENVERVYLANPSVAPEDILHAIAFELQLQLPAGADRLQVMQALHTYLIERHSQGRQVVIFVEEAQGMPIATLEEIRLLSNLETRRNKLLQIVLFGQPELDQNLNEPHIRQLKERITHSFNLGPLTEKEAEGYLISRLRTAGYFGPPLFTPAAVKKMVKAAQGLIRRINILADKALLAAYAENVYAITPKHVGIAIQDSEFSMENTPRRSTKSYWLAAAMLVGGVALGIGAQYLTARLEGFKPAVGHAVVAKPTPAQAPVAKTEPATPSPVSPAPQIPASPATVAPTQTISVNTETPLPGKTAPVPQAANMLELRMQVTETWLAQQSPDTFSIQLMRGNDAQLVQAQIESFASQVALDNIYVFRTTSASQPYISVLYGAFNDRASAVKALNELPMSLKTYRPQLRTVGGVRKEISPFQ